MQETTPGEAMAKAFRYHLQFQKRGTVERAIPLRCIRAKVFYGKHKKEFDKVAAAFERHGLDPAKYAEFLAAQLKFNEWSDFGKMSDPSNLRKFQAYVQYEKKRDDAYAQYNKTVRNLAEACVRRKCRAAKCISDVVRSGRLSSLYMCGVVSRYFLSAIPGFGAAVDKLDQFSRMELGDLKEKYDIYRAIVCDAFVRKEKRRPDPVQDVDFEAAKIVKASKKVKDGPDAV